jgi:hypothetical protein
LKIDESVFGLKIHARFPGDGHAAGFRGVLEMTMASLL